MVTLGDRIKECRRARGWRLDDLAAKARVSKGFLSDLENSHQKNPGINYLEAIAEALGVDLLYLTTGESPRAANGTVEIPAALLELAKEEQLSTTQTMMLLDARRQIVSHRANASKSDDLRDFTWRPFYEALKPFLR